MEEAVFFRNQLREARSAVLRDAEAFDLIIFAVERLGHFMTSRVGDLGKYTGVLRNLAGVSPLAEEVPTEVPESHCGFGSLYESLRQARNDAVHQGAVARHLSSHAVKVALVLEDALMNDCDKVIDFMVHNPVCAELWQPLSFVRQTMLGSSFSYLPVKTDEQGRAAWRLISDSALAAYFRNPKMPGDRKSRLVKRLGDAVKEGCLSLSEARTCGVHDCVSKVLENCDSRPVLVLRANPPDLLGILTPYDLL